jgi:hypothetical protein
MVKRAARMHQRKEEMIMKTLRETFETTMAAAAFAEAGEFETARQIMNEDRPRKSDRPSVRDYQRPIARKELRAD